MKVLLTGAGSFIGRDLGAYLHGQASTIYGTVRKDKQDSFKPLWLKKIFIMDLNETIERVDASMFEGVNCVIHLAHDFRDNMMETNIEGTRRIAEKAANAGVSMQIFFSSYSARPDAVSEYGMTKYRLEQYFLKEGHTVVRPGLVIGNGGLFLKFFKAVRKFPIIPLPGGGKGEVPIISMRQLCVVIDKIISSPPMPAKEYNIFYPDMTTMKTLIDTMKAVAGSRTVVIPFPTGVLVLASGLGKVLGIKLPFNVDSLRSFRKNQKRIHSSNIGMMLGEYDSVHDAVEAAFMQ